MFKKIYDMNTNTITYTPIDLEIDFADILNDSEAMENQLNKELGLTISPI